MNVNYKIGDKVKIIGNSNGSSNEIGDIGIITENTNHSKPSYANYDLYRVTVIGRSNRFNNTRHYDMELYYDDTAKLLDPETAQSTTGEIFKIGDIVNYDNSKCTINRFEDRNPEIFAILNEEFNSVNINELDLYIDKFKLPERYCVRHHQKVARYIMDVLKTPGGYHEDLRLYSHFPTFSRGTHCSNCIQPGYTEITYEQFKKYVLNE